ncbi:hypothetical protein SNEBB_009904 [Seison nebaliae]|nr:hypothetical protein SNEBB_009904 [Seison nebaliae]
MDRTKYGMSYNENHIKSEGNLCRTILSYQQIPSIELIPETVLIHREGENEKNKQINVSTNSLNSFPSLPFLTSIEEDRTSIMTKRNLSEIYPSSKLVRISENMKLPVILNKPTTKVKTSPNELVEVERTKKLEKLKKTRTEEEMELYSKKKQQQIVVEGYLKEFLNNKETIPFRPGGRDDYLPKSIISSTVADKFIAKSNLTINSNINYKNFDFSNIQHHRNISLSSSMNYFNEDKSTNKSNVGWSYERAALTKSINTKLFQPSFEQEQERRKLEKEIEVTMQENYSKKTRNEKKLGNLSKRPISIDKVIDSSVEKIHLPKLKQNTTLPNKAFFRQSDEMKRIKLSRKSVRTNNSSIDNQLINVQNFALASTNDNKNNYLNTQRLQEERRIIEIVKETSRNISSRCSFTSSLIEKSIVNLKENEENNVENRRIEYRKLLESALSGSKNDSRKTDRTNFTLHISDDVIDELINEDLSKENIDLQLKLNEEECTIVKVDMDDIPLVGETTIRIDRTHEELPPIEIKSFDLESTDSGIFQVQIKVFDKDEKDETHDYKVDAIKPEYIKRTKKLKKNSQDKIRENMLEQIISEEHNDDLTILDSHPLIEDSITTITSENQTVTELQNNKDLSNIDIKEICKSSFRKPSKESEIKSKDLDLEVKNEKHIQFSDNTIALQHEKEQKKRLMLQMKNELKEKRKKKQIQPIPDDLKEEDKKVELPDKTLDEEKLEKEKNEERRIQLAFQFARLQFHRYIYVNAYGIDNHVRNVSRAYITSYFDRTKLKKGKKKEKKSKKNRMSSKDMALIEIQRKLRRIDEKLEDLHIELSK